MILNFENVEEQVFRDRKLCRRLPEFSELFNRWRVAQQSSAGRQVARRAVMDFLNSLESEHIKKLKDYFQEDVLGETLNYNLVKNDQIVVDDLVFPRQEFNLAISRNKNNINITFWR